LDAGGDRHLVVGKAAPTRLRVSGAPGELLLYFAGRGAAEVSVEGDDEAIRSIEAGLRI
jgi:hypothetical protein